MKEEFDKKFKDKFIAAGLVPDGKLQHLISDNATMQVLKWKDGRFGFAMHNQDGDMITDEISQVHKSPGFITSSLVGYTDDGKTLIKEFEASHGTVTDLWDMHLAGKETSLNPLGLVTALVSAIDHAADVNGKTDTVSPFTKRLTKIMHNSFSKGQGTKDLCGSSGLSTEAYVD